MGKILTSWNKHHSAFQMGKVFEAVNSCQYFVIEREKMAITIIVGFKNIRKMKMGSENLLGMDWFWRNNEFGSLSQIQIADWKTRVLKLKFCVCLEWMGAAAQLGIWRSILKRTIITILQPIETTVVFTDCTVRGTDYVIRIRESFFKNTTKTLYNSPAIKPRF